MARGLETIRAHALLNFAAYNLTRLSNLPAPQSDGAIAPFDLRHLIVEYLVFAATGALPNYGCTIGWKSDWNRHQGGSGRIFSASFFFQAAGNRR